MSETDKIIWFQDGLNPQTKFEVERFETQAKSSGTRTTLEAIMEVAVNYELCLGKKTVGVNYTVKKKNFKKYHGKGRFFRNGPNKQGFSDAMDVEIKL